MAIRASYDWHSATWQPHFGSDLAVSLQLLYIVQCPLCTTSPVSSVCQQLILFGKFTQKSKMLIFPSCAFYPSRIFLCASCQVLEMLARETLRFSLYLMLFIVLFGAVRITRKVPSRFITSEKRWTSRWPKSVKLSTTHTLTFLIDKWQLGWKILSVDSAVIAPKCSFVSVRIIWPAEQANKRLPSTLSVFKGF